MLFHVMEVYMPVSEVLSGVPPTKRGKHTLSKFRHEESRFFLR